MRLLLSPSIKFEAFSLGLLLNFLYSGNLISNKEPDWSVEYEFYCCVETWFYCAAGKTRSNWVMSDLQPSPHRSCYPLKCQGSQLPLTMDQNFTLVLDFWFPLDPRWQKPNASSTHLGSLTVPEKFHSLSFFLFFGWKLWKGQRWWGRHSEGELDCQFRVLGWVHTHRRMEDMNQ